MKDYSKVNPDAMTIEDIMQDAEWGKRPSDYFSYLAVSDALLESMCMDFNDHEIGEIMRTIAEYCITGVLPDYTTMCSSGVKSTVRALIRDHDKRMEAEYRKHYKQYIAAKKGKS